MATQKDVNEKLKLWQEAEGIREATEAARQAAEAFDSLYTESATNLLARTPDLMLLLSAVQAGRLMEAAKHGTATQEGLL